MDTTPDRGLGHHAASKKTWSAPLAPPPATPDRDAMASAPGPAEGASAGRALPNRDGRQSQLVRSE